MFHYRRSNVELLASQHILLVEDEPQLAQALKLALKKLGAQTTHVSTLAQARNIPLSKVPDCILLDRTLPDGDGLELCSWLRQQHYNGAILMLTARGAVEERVTGLKAGADDYLPKPFSWDELHARLYSLVRRRQNYSDLQNNSKLWDCDESKLAIQGPLGLVTLTALEFKLAQRLIIAAGSIVKREDLLKEVWGFKWLPQTRTVDYFMGRLRKHFEPDKENPRHFQTVRGVGYRFTP